MSAYSSVCEHETCKRNNGLVTVPGLLGLDTGCCSSDGDDGKAGCGCLLISGCDSTPLRAAMMAPENCGYCPPKVPRGGLALQADFFNLRLPGRPGLIKTNRLHHAYRKQRCSPFCHSRPNRPWRRNGPVTSHYTNISAQSINVFRVL